jgi:hypothetical protein
MIMPNANQFGEMLCTALLWLAIPNAQTPPEMQRKSLELHIREVTGAPRESVVDCGDYGISGSTPYDLPHLQDSRACARDAATRLKPFRIVVHGITEDSQTAYGVLANFAGSKQGVFWFQYDSAPCGGPVCAERFEISPWYVQDIVVFVNDQGQYEL